MSMGALFAPRGLVVVGASRHPAKLGAALARSLRTFPGHVGLVNRRDPDPAAGISASIRDAAADGPVDLAMICVPAPGCAAAVAEAAEAGARAAVIYGGGFAEAGPSGERHQRELAAVAASTGIRLLGPNTSGFFAPGQRLTASFVPGAADVPAGRVAVVAASGGINHALAFLLADAGHGVSLAVGIGNGADVSAADVLDHLERDETTTAVALHVESVAQGRRLVEAVARLSRSRPVVALVVGRNDVGAFAASHTGALATAWRVTRAALAQAGAVLVDDERELIDAVGALSLTRMPPSPNPGIGVVTAQAGPGLLVLDQLRGRGVRVPELSERCRSALAEVLPPLTFQRNPVDTGRPGPGFERVVGEVAAEVDLVAVYALHEPDAVDLVHALGPATGATAPVVAAVGGASAGARRVRGDLLARAVPVAADPHGLAAMAAALVADARARHRLDAGEVPDPIAIPEPGGGPWDEDQAKTLLEKLGVPTMPRRACASRAEAHRALNDLPGPVAVKLLDPSVLHKTELGGVRLGVATAGQLGDALDALEAVGAQRFLVESMAPAGVDLVVGARRDPVFGPVVLVGLGGTTAEALDDVAVRLAPLSTSEAEAMPDELSGRVLLDGWRGGPVLDRTALAGIVVALGALLDAYPNLAEVEINPLRLTAGGLVALDALCISTESEG